MNIRKFLSDFIIVVFVLTIYWSEISPNLSNSELQLLNIANILKNIIFERDVGNLDKNKSDL